MEAWWDVGVSHAARIFLCILWTSILSVGFCQECDNTSIPGQLGYPAHVQLTILHPRIVFYGCTCRCLKNLGHLRKTREILSVPVEEDPTIVQISSSHFYT